MKTKHKAKSATDIVFSPEYIFPRTLDSRWRMRHITLDLQKTLGCVLEVVNNKYIYHFFF